MLNINLTFAPYPIPEMAPKKKPPPQHVSLTRIEMERVAVAQRTRTRIALLLTHAQDDKAEEVPVAKNPQHYYCQTTCCFCVLLLLMNLLFLQWLYYKVHNVKL